MGQPMDRSNRVSGKLTTFQDASPALESATISSYEIGEGTFASQREQTFGPPRPFTSASLDNVVGSSLRVDLAGAGPQPPVPLNLIHHAAFRAFPPFPFLACFLLSKSTPTVV